MKRHQWLFLIIILSIGFFLRVYNLESIPPGIHGDEAEFGIIEQKIIRGNYNNFFALGDTGSLFGFSVLSYWTQGIFQLLFNQTVLGIRISSAIIGVITIIPFYFLTKLYFKNHIISVLTTLALATSHYHIAFSRLALSNIFTPFFITSSFYFFYLGIKTKSAKQSRYVFTISSVFLGLSQYFHYTVKVIPIIFAAYFIIYILNRKKHIKEIMPQLIWLIIPAIIIFAPHGIHFLIHPNYYASRINTVSIFSHLTEYYQRYHVTSIIGVLFWQFINTLKVFNFGGDIGFYIYGYQGGLLTPIVSLLAVVGLLLSLVKIKKEKYFFLVIWFFSIIILGGTLTIDAPSSQRLVGTIPVLFLFVGVTLESINTLKHKLLLPFFILIFILNGIWDYKIYFIDYINSQAGWAQKEPATQIAYYLKSLGTNWKVYMLRENTWLYFRHGTIRFLNPNLEGVDMENSNDAIPIKESTNKNVVYIMPPLSNSITNIKQFYPRGLQRHFFSPIGQTPAFTSYEIKNSDLKINMVK